MDMKVYRHYLSSHNRLMLIIGLTLVIGLLGLHLINHYTSSGARDKVNSDSVEGGYYALRLFLQDEQYLTTIRRMKMVVTLRGISEKASSLIDDISDASEQAVEELEELAMLKPAIIYPRMSDDSIAKTTLDSLRLKTAKEFLLKSDDFEKNILISQLHALRVISHLAAQLERKDSNIDRKKWLENLVTRYEDFYQQVYAMIAVTA